MKHRDCEGTQSHGLAAEMLAALFALDLGIPVQPPLIVSIESGFAASLTDPYLRGIGNKNIGPNFATDQWKPGFDRWHPGYELTPNMLQTLGEIMAFDAMIQNPDRQRGKNPNCAVLDEEIIAFDHEMAFQAAYSRTPPPWRDKGMDFLNRHAFRHLFSSRRLDLSRLRVEVEQLPAARIDEYREHIPPSWANPEVLDRLIGFLQGSVANRDTLLAKLEGL